MVWTKGQYKRPLHPVVSPDCFCHMVTDSGQFVLAGCNGQPLRQCSARAALSFRCAEFVQRLGSCHPKMILSIEKPLEITNNLGAFLWQTRKLQRLICSVSGFRQEVLLLICQYSVDSVVGISAEAWRDNKLCSLNVFTAYIHTRSFKSQYLTGKIWLRPSVKPDSSVSASPQPQKDHVNPPSNRMESHGNSSKLMDIDEDCYSMLWIACCTTFFSR